MTSKSPEPKSDETDGNYRINLPVLDKLVLDYAQEQERNQQDSIRNYIQLTSSWVKTGNFDALIEELNKKDETLMKDPSLKLSIIKQEFIELIRQQEDLTKAMDYAKKVFAPYALDAFPEAYDLFKSILILLIYIKKENGCNSISERAPSSLVEEFSEKTRDQLIESLGMTLTYLEDQMESTLSQIFKYLLKVYQVQKSYTDMEGDESNEIDGLLLPFRKIAPIRKNLTEYFQESDVQILVNNLAISRQEAVDALRYTNGDLELAFKKELGRIQLDHHLLMELCTEYCEMRGLSKISSHLDVDRGSGETAKSSRLQKIRELASQNEISELLREILIWDECVPEKYPDLYFKLRRCEFLKKASQGQSDRALKIAREDMAPATKGSKELAGLLKETFPALIITNPKEESRAFTEITKVDTVRGLDLSSLASSLCDILGEDLDLNRSRLIVTLSFLIGVHSKWLETQMMQDPFETTLGLQNLKKLSTEHEPFSQQNLSTTEESHDPTRTDHHSHVQPDESSIVTIMEVLAFNRVEAINLLNQYNGDLDAIFQSLLS